MSNRNKVFVSYHHARDEACKTTFERSGSIFDVLIPGSVNDADIDSNLPAETIRQKLRDEYRRDTSVTVVLIGTETSQRKHIDWGIGSPIRQTEYNPRSGLFGILLPTYPRADPTKYNPHTIPPRLTTTSSASSPPSTTGHTTPRRSKAGFTTPTCGRARSSPTTPERRLGLTRSGTEWTY